jgi:hypothetical protein
MTTWGIQSTCCGAIGMPGHQVLRCWAHWRDHKGGGQEGAEGEAGWHVKLWLRACSAAEVGHRNCCCTIKLHLTPTLDCSLR